VIEVRESDRHDRGVFATRDIRKGTLMEVTPMLVLPAKEWKYLEKTLFAHYVFEYGKSVAFAVGITSFLNHSYTPNARYWIDEDERTIDVVALRKIRKDEEITINYNAEPDDDTLLWFDVES
jgi:SET domain-containing protein